MRCVALEAVATGLPTASLHNPMTAAVAALEGVGLPHPIDVNDGNVPIRPRGRDDLVAAHSDQSIV